MVFENTDLPSNPLLDEYPRMRHVIIDKNTTALVRTAKNITDFNTEVSRARNGAGSLTILPYIEGYADVSKIQPGQYLQVMAREQGSAYKETFTASQVIVNPSPSFVQTQGKR